MKNYKNIIKIGLLYDINPEDEDIEYDFAFYMFQNKEIIEKSIPCRILNVSMEPEDKLLYSNFEDIIAVYNVITVELELDIDMQQQSILNEIEEISMLEGKIKSIFIQMLCNEFTDFYVTPYFSMYGGCLNIKEEEELIKSRDY